MHLDTKQFITAYTPPPVTSPSPYAYPPALIPSCILVPLYVSKMSDREYDPHDKQGFVFKSMARRMQGAINAQQRRTTTMVRNRDQCCDTVKANIHTAPASLQYPSVGTVYRNDMPLAFTQNMFSAIRHYTVGTHYLWLTHSCGSLETFVNLMSEMNIFYR